MSAQSLQKVGTSKEIRPAFRVAHSSDPKSNFKFVDEYDPAKKTLIRKQARAWVNENRELDLFKLDIESRDEIPCNREQTSAIAQSTSYHNGFTPTTGATALTKEEEEENPTAGTETQLEFSQFHHDADLCHTPLFVPTGNESGSFFYQPIHQTPVHVIETCAVAIERLIHSWMDALCQSLAQTIARALLAYVRQQRTVPDELCKSPPAKILAWVAGIDNPDYQPIPIVFLKWIAESVLLEHKKIPCGYAQREADNLDALFDALKSYEQLTKATWLSKLQDDSTQNASTIACHIGGQPEDLVSSQGKSYQSDTNHLNGQVGPIPWDSSNSTTFPQPLYQLAPLSQAIDPPAPQEPDHLLVSVYNEGFKSNSALSLSSCLSQSPLYTSSKSMLELPLASPFVALPDMTLESHVEQPLGQGFAENGILPEIFKVSEIERYESNSRLSREYRYVASQFDASQTTSPDFAPADGTFVYPTLLQPPVDALCTSDTDRLGGQSGSVPPANPSRQRTNLNETRIGFEKVNPLIYQPSQTPISIVQTPNILAPSLHTLPVDVLQFSHKGFELLVPVELSNYSSTLVKALKNIVDDGALEEVKEVTNVDVIMFHQQVAFALINLPETRREELNGTYGYPIVLVEECSMVVSGLFITSIKRCLGLKQGQRFFLHEYFKGENFARVFYDELYTNSQLKSRHLRPKIGRPTQDETSQETSIPMSREPVRQNASKEARETDQKSGYDNAESQGHSPAATTTVIPQTTFTILKRTKRAITATTSQLAKRQRSTPHA
ncbi:hypothetical protein GQ44DRAFT_784905 [Phaeosphaeriaceae sp. PMI808]|nr:hypothetical protein GQ44DRAFT_784905 [Phaeosphaeriaceae sp. PMI808]